MLEVSVSREFDRLLRRTNYMLNYLTRHSFAGSGLTLTRFWVLLDVANRERTTMSQLQKVILISQGSLTTVVDGMVAEGLLIRERCQEDRRRVLLQLSPAGRKLLEEAKAYRSAVLAEVLGLDESSGDGAAGSSLTPTELKAVKSVLERVENGLVEIVRKKSAKTREEEE